MKTRSASRKTQSAKQTLHRARKSRSAQKTRLLYRPPESVHDSTTSAISIDLTVPNEPPKSLELQIVKVGRYEDDILSAWEQYMIRMGFIVRNQEPLDSDIIKDRLLHSHDRICEASKCIKAVWEQRCVFDTTQRMQDVRELLSSVKGRLNDSEAVQYIETVRSMPPLCDEVHLLAVLIDATMFHWVFKQARAVIAPIQGLDPVSKLKDDFIDLCEYNTLAEMYVADIL